MIHHLKQLRIQRRFHPQHHCRIKAPIRTYNTRARSFSSDASSALASGCSEVSSALGDWGSRASSSAIDNVNNDEQKNRHNNSAADSMNTTEDLSLTSCNRGIENSLYVMSHHS